jgi:hypothetical protein
MRWDYTIYVAVCWRVPQKTRKKGAQSPKRKGRLMRITPKTVPE